MKFKVIQSVSNAWKHLNDKDFDEIKKTAFISTDYINLT